MVKYEAVLRERLTEGGLDMFRGGTVDRRRQEESRRKSREVS